MQELVTAIWEAAEPLAEASPGLRRAEGGAGPLAGRGRTPESGEEQNMEI